MKQSKINTLTQEYELFRMEPSKIMKSMQMGFINLINRLERLGKNLSNQNCDSRVIRSMWREWEQKNNCHKKSQ